mgnify:CR=1 FL=1
MTDEKLPTIHPGEVLREEFMDPLGISAYRLAKDIGVPPTRIHAIVTERRAITADTAARLARYFGTSLRFWQNLQMDHDAEQLHRDPAHRAAIQRIEPLGTS